MILLFPDVMRHIHGQTRHAAFTTSSWGSFGLNSTVTWRWSTTGEWSGNHLADHTWVKATFKGSTVPHRIQLELVVAKTVMTLFSSTLVHLSAWNLWHCKHANLAHADNFILIYENGQECHRCPIFLYNELLWAFKLQSYHCIVICMGVPHLYKSGSLDAFTWLPKR